MAYKDKQREANRVAAKRYRLKRKGMTQASDTVIPEQPLTVIPKPEPQSHSPMVTGYVPPKVK